MANKSGHSSLPVLASFVGMSAGRGPRGPIQKRHQFKRTREDILLSRRRKMNLACQREDMLGATVRDSSLEPKIVLCPSVICVGFN